ncbi:hypothetical protein AABM38_21955 [Heyndrickxia sp. MSNUG]|uniref:hypothetical protein n=1 Tax=Heyndrickxia sp. MSNUG TaxID=3136677 RepID=UPI003C30CB24
MKRQHQLRILPIFIGISILVFIFIVLRIFMFGLSNQATQTVEKFYAYEQEGNFSDSWSLFHPYMKQRFTKSEFIQDRAHVFIGHFGAETFTYEISKAEKFDKWTPENGQNVVKNGYKMVVTQNYNGKYGNFNFQQVVYVVKHKGEWVILWDYN